LKSEAYLILNPDLFVMLENQALLSLARLCLAICPSAESGYLLPRSFKHFWYFARTPFWR
jgi:hypothetical protein